MIGTTAQHDDPLAFLNGTAAERKRANRSSKTVLRTFIIWDGEGANTAGPGKPQSYILFGAYNGTRHYRIESKHLSTLECLELICDVGRDNPRAIHVGFAFGYDVNMILRDLPSESFAQLRDRGYIFIGRYKVSHVPTKWIRVTDRRTKLTVTIADVWGFFQSSFLAAIKSYIPDNPLMVHLPQIEAGKKARSTFTLADMDSIRSYWEIENELAWFLVNKLRELLYAVDLKITKWHGPGALASHVYGRENIRQHKSDTDERVYDAARYAYAGGRFERFHIGRYEAVYGYDINSAYPNAIARLPSLSEGEWIYTATPKRILEFGMYRVSLRGPAIARKPSPLFHRDKAGNITYPWRLDGWYWGPELRALRDTLPDFQGIKILEGWEYVGWTTRPFAFVADVYADRRQMKAEGIGAQIALKLLLNSLYGKMAQRAGWERSGGPPPWHQLEWAGWVTSYTRAMLYRLMMSIPYNKLIAVETDGIYSTATPDELGVTHSTELGGWEIKQYDELVYLQSGLYAKRQGNDWSIKHRGLDPESFPGDTVDERAWHMVNHSKLLVPGDEWPNITGTTTRFIGYRNALFRQQQNRGPVKTHHCVWETSSRELSCGNIGKRIHSPRICLACKVGAPAYDVPHDTIINSRTTIMADDELMSHRHDIPWLDIDRANWRVFNDNDDYETR